MYGLTRWSFNKKGIIWNKECDHFTREEKHTDSTAGLMHSPDFDNERPIMHHASGSLHLLVIDDFIFDLNIWRCNKMTFLLSFTYCSATENLDWGMNCRQWGVSKFIFAGVDRIHTWFSDIGERVTDWSQTKHILGLHFEVVPGWKQTKTYGFNDNEVPVVKVSFCQFCCDWV